jgi:signal peptidase II
MTTQRFLFCALVSGAVLGLDQASKIAVRSSLDIGAAVPVIPGVFNLVHVTNHGAAFGLLNNADMTWQTYLFAAASVVAVIALLFLVAQARDDETAFLWGASMVLGGALGNLVDRLSLGHVTDFLDVYFKSYHWPAFNLADAGICLGAGLLLFSVYQRGQHVPDSD